MSIRNMKHYTAALWDWGVFDGCFGGKIAISDIDGLVERRGQFLLLEAKSPGSRIPDGQRYLHEALYRRGDFSLLYIWGKPGQPEWIHFRLPRPFPEYRGPVTLDELRAIVKWWYQMADTGAFRDRRKARSLPPPPYPNYSTAGIVVSTA